MRIHSRFPVTEKLIDRYSEQLGRDLLAYRNHTCRVLNFYAALSRFDELPEAVLIAAAFHDLGIWTDDTFDYLEPSIRLAQRHLAFIGHTHLDDEVAALIREHHKLSPYTSRYAGTVERFRQADTIDVTLGLVRFGLPATFVREVQAQFPNAGFHWRLCTLTARQFLRTPLRPLPMFRK